MFAVPLPNTMAVTRLLAVATLALLTVRLVMLLTVSPPTKPVNVKLVGATTVEPLYTPLALMPNAALLTVKVLSEVPGAAL